MNVKDIINPQTAETTEEAGIMLLSATPETEKHIIINKDRTVIVPDELKDIAVQFDHNIETVTFDCPRYWDNKDFSKMHVYVNYRCADGKMEQYPCKPPIIDEADESIIHFEWTISRNVTCAKGKISFLVCVKNPDENGVLQNQWSSRLNQEMEILEGLECTSEEIIAENPDVIEQILSRLDVLEKNGEGATTDLADVNKKIGELSEAIGKISQDIADLSGYEVLQLLIDMELAPVLVDDTGAVLADENGILLNLEG